MPDWIRGMLDRLAEQKLKQDRQLTAWQRFGLPVSGDSPSLNLYYARREHDENFRKMVR